MHLISAMGGAPPEKKQAPAVIYDKNCPGIIYGIFDSAAEAEQCLADKGYKRLARPENWWKSQPNAMVTTYCVSTLRDAEQLPLAK